MSGNIVWKQKYSIYPFTLPNGVDGYMRIKEHKCIEVFLVKDGAPELIFKQKTVQKAVIKLTAMNAEQTSDKA